MVEDIISIHVPTRGTTLDLSDDLYRVSNFNPRSYERNDFLALKSVKTFSNFNPRSYERNDSFFTTMRNYPTDFNPRSYERNDTGCCILRVAL